MERIVIAVLLAGLVFLLTACGGVAGLAPQRVPRSADALLLTQTDLPAAAVRQMQQFQERETRRGGQSAQVVLEQNGARIFQSVVVFPSEQIARTAVQSVRDGGPGALWEEVPSAPAFGQESLVFTGQQGGQEAVLVIFRQGRILERLTLVGSTDVEAILPYARKAEEKLAGGR